MFHESAAPANGAWRPRPRTWPGWSKLGFEVLVETQAGALASFGDDDYATAGARVVDDTRALWQEADIILKVQPPDHHPVLGVHEARPAA